MIAAYDVPRLRDDDPRYSAFYMKKTISIIVLTILTFAFAQNVLAIGMVSEPIIIKDVSTSLNMTLK